MCGWGVFLSRERNVVSLHPCSYIPLFPSGVAFFLPCLLYQHEILTLNDLFGLF